MHRFLFAIALIIFQVLMGDMNSYARMNQHAQFATLSLAERKQVVVEVMRIVVSIEAKYKHEILKPKPNQSKLKKYTYLLQKAEAFLMNSAHAASSYTPRFQNFRSLLDNPDKCIYGGWISRMTKSGYCTHPMNLRQGTPERVGYTNQGCRSPGEISCNPLIFGFKKQSDDSLFCVPAGLSGNNAHNSSLRCMEKALSEEGDGAEKRLSDLAKEVVDHPSQAKALFEFVSRACICEAELPGLNEKYHQYMRPHRTCLSLMKMLSRTVSDDACVTPPVLGDNLALIQSLGSKIVATYSRGSEAQADEDYKKLLIDLRGSPEFRNFCSNDDLSDIDDDGSSGGDDSGSGNSGNGSDDGNGNAGYDGNSDGSNGNTNTDSTNGSDGDQGLQSADPDQINPAGDDDDTDSTLIVTDDPSGGGGPITDSGGSDANPPLGGENPIDGGGSGNTDTIPPTDTDTGSNIDGSGNEAAAANSPLSIVVDIVNQDDAMAQLEAKTDPELLPEGVVIVWFAKGETLPESDPQSADPDEDGSAPEAPVATPTPLAPIDLSNVNLGKDELEVAGQKRYSLSNKMIVVDKIDGSYQMCAKLVKGDVIVAAESCKEINGDDADDDVPVSDEGKDEKKPHKYTLTLDPKTGSVSVTIKVTITPDPEAGAKIIWIKRSPKEKTKVLPGSAGGEEEPKKEDEQIELEDAKKNEIKDAEDKKDIDVKPEETDKEVCAVIYEEGKQASNLACTTVGKKSSSADDKDKNKNKGPVGPYMPTGPQGPPMIPLRGGGDMMIRGVY